MGLVDYTGETIDGKYRILRLLGMGEMSSFYLGEHTTIGRRVTVKLLHASKLLHANHSKFVERFFREASAASAICRKHIVEVLDIGITANNEPYLIMEYLKGETLAAMLNRTGPIDLPAACAILEPALQALVAVHGGGIVHRDLHPKNIFLVHDPYEVPVVKLIGFGFSHISKQTDISGLPRTGTAIYMSPEQIRGSEEEDPRSDLYSMGVILYEMLTGRLPYVGKSYSSLLVSILTSDPLPPKEAYTFFPIEAESLVLRLVSKNPSTRPKNAHSLLKEIKVFSGFDQRQKRLEHYSGGIEEQNVCVGDLGEDIPEELSEPASLSVSTTPAEWTESEVSNRLIFPNTAKHLVVVLAGAICILLTFYLVTNGTDDRTAVMPLNSVPTFRSNLQNETVEKTVSIELDGLPKTATVFIDDILMTGNPIEVEQLNIPMRLRVDAPGYKTFLVSLVPDRDHRIVIQLYPEKNEASAGDNRAAANTSEKGRRISTIGKTASHLDDFYDDESDIEVGTWTQTSESSIRKTRLSTTAFEKKFFGHLEKKELFFTKEVKDEVKLFISKTPDKDLSLRSEAIRDLVSAIRNEALDSDGELDAIDWQNVKCVFCPRVPFCKCPSPEECPENDCNK